MLDNILVVVIAFLGVVVGYILSKFTKEEIKPGRKYFIWLKKIILFILAIALLYNVWGDYWVLIGWVVFGFIVAFLINLYFFLGLALFSSFSISNDFVLLVAALVFMFGLPFGSLMKKLDILEGALLFALPFILVFFSNVNTNLFSAISAGGLIYFICRSEK